MLVDRGWSLGISLGEALEALGDQSHQFGDGADVPIRVGHPDMSHVSGQGGDRVIDIDLVLIPAELAIGNEGMAKIIDAWSRVVAPGDPAQPLAQRAESVLDGTQLQRSTPLRQEEVLIDCE